MITPHHSRELIDRIPATGAVQRRLGVVSTAVALGVGLVASYGIARFAGGYPAAEALPAGDAAVLIVAAAALHAVLQRWVQGTRTGALIMLAVVGALTVGGRAASTPGTVLGVSLLALALLALATPRLTRGAMSVAVGAAIVAATIGGNAIAVRALGIPVAFGWGRWSAMPIVTAILVCALALALVLAAMRIGLEVGLTVRRWLPALATGAVVGATIVMWQSILEHDRRVAESAVRRQADAMAGALAGSAREHARLLQRLSTRWANDRAHDPAAWTYSATEFVRDYPGMLALGWADAGTRLRWSGPGEGVAFVARGARLDAEPRTGILVRQVGATHAPAASAPVRDDAGGAGYLVLSPILRAGQVVGYLASALDASAFIEGAFAAEDAGDYAFGVYDGDVALHRRPRAETASVERWEVRVPVEAMGRRWELRVVPTPHVLAEIRSPVSAVFLVGGLLLAALVGWIVFAAQRSRELSGQLAGLVNELAKENAARRQSQQLQGALVHSTLDGLAAFDAAGCVSAWNPRMSYLTGRAEVDVDGQMVGDMLSFLPPGAEVPLLLDALAGIGTQLPDIPTTIPETGEQVWLDVTVTPLRSEDGRTLGGLLVARDVTERKRVADIVLAGKLAAEEANRSKSNFLARMSHELRTPLNAVIGFTNVLRRNHHGRLERDELTYLERINANGRHLLGLINEVLDLAKVESGHVVAECAPASLAALVRDTVSELDVRASGASVRLSVELPPGPLEIETDAPKLKQVLINLIGNAIKFTPAAGVVVVRVRADAQTSRPTRIEVEDSGIGIPPDRHEAIFEAFEQVDADTSRRFGGTGLGLAISRRLCTLLGHELVVQSEVGVGSTFSIILPAAEVEQAAA